METQPTAQQESDTGDKAPEPPETRTARDGTRRGLCGRSKVQALENLRRARQGTKGDVGHGPRQPPARRPSASVAKPANTKLFRGTRILLETTREARGLLGQTMRAVANASISAAAGQAITSAIKVALLALEQEERRPDASKMATRFKVVLDDKGLVGAQVEQGGQVTEIVVQDQRSAPKELAAAAGLSDDEVFG